MAVERDAKGRLRKGSVLNPTGRGAAAEARLNAALRSVGNDDVIAVFDKLHAKALRGDVRAAELWLSYVVGKPVQKSEVSGEDGREIVFTIVRRSAED